MKAGVEPSAGSDSWQSWMTALKTSNQQLKQHLDAGDWEKAQAELDCRDNLLGERFQRLLRRQRASAAVDPFPESLQVRQLLEEIQATGREFIETLQSQRQELSSKINGVQNGRRTVGLYRQPGPATPRFLDRRG